uniref:Uncharacterized protein n=1 Tax=Ditylenchus dipsaci TaxID=166011 RepID=A0A915CRY3_9BILA
MTSSAPFQRILTSSEVYHDIIQNFDLQTCSRLIFMSAKAANFILLRGDKLMIHRILFNPSQFALGRVAATALLGSLDMFTSDQRFVVIAFPDSDKTLVMEIQGVPAFQAMAMDPRPIPPLIPTVHDLKQLLADEFPRSLEVV